MWNQFANRWPCACWILGIFLHGGAARAQCWEQKIPGLPQGGGEHGRSVAIYGDVAVIGAPGKDVGGLARRGEVTVARWDGTVWNSSPLTAPAATGAGDEFGFAVAVDSFPERIAVGAPFNDTLAPDGGMVAVYEWNTNTLDWDLTQVWHGVFGSGLFGFSLDATYDEIAVGEPGALAGAGTVNVFEKSGAVWNNIGFHVGAAAFDFFGWSVALDNTLLLVGAPFADSSAADGGAAYFYSKPGGVYVFDQQVSGTEAGEHLGSACDLSLTDAVVSSPHRDWYFVDAGMVTFFRYTGTWSTSTQAGGQGTGDEFGASVALLGKAALVGVPGAGAAWGVAAGAGVCQKLEYDHSLQHWDWSPINFTASDVAAQDRFGSAVDVGYSHWLIGAPLSDASAGDAGSAYAYDGQPQGGFVDVGNGLAGYNNWTPRLYGSGALCGNTRTYLSIGNALPYGITFLVLGTTGIYAPFAGGIMVPQPSNMIGPIILDCSGWAYLQGWWPTGLPATTVYLQTWTADPFAPGGLSASNGLVINSSGG